MKKSFYKKTRKGLPGGPNEQVSIIEGSISMQGYKSDSPDVNNDFNIIPTGNITMEDVDFSVLGIDNLGNSEIMMPGANYIFPGNMVFEIPLAQVGEELSEEENTVSYLSRKLSDLQDNIGTYLNNPGQRAKDFSDSEEELANIDNLRHSMASRFAAEEIQNKIKGIPKVGGFLDKIGVDKLAGFLGSNLLGLGHEASTLVEDDRPILAALQESGEDVINNLIGSVIGSTDMSPEKKTNILTFLSDNNLMPDGYVQTDPDASENVYLKNPDGSIKQFGGDSTSEMSNEAKEILYSYADASKLEQDIVEGKVTNPEVIDYFITLKITGVPEMYPGSNEDLKKLYDDLYQPGRDLKLKFNLTGEQIANAAEKLYEEKTDITRGPAGRKEKLLSTLFPITGCYFDNTCVQAVKDVYKEANIESNIPDDVYDNRTFFENYESYGYELIEDPNDLQRGDILQYYFPARDAFTVETLFQDFEIDAMGDYPFHIGVYVGDEMYISDPDENNPLTKANIYKDKQGKEKEPFKIFRKVDNKLAEKKVGVELRKNKNKKTLELIKKFKGGENISSAGKQYLKELGYIR